MINRVERVRKYIQEHNLSKKELVKQIGFWLIEERPCSVCPLGARCKLCYTVFPKKLRYTNLPQIRHSHRQTTYEGGLNA